MNIDATTRPALVIKKGAVSELKSADLPRLSTLFMLSIHFEAECQLERGGHTIGVVNPSPNSVRISKSHSTISVQCSKDGYEDGEAALEAGFQPMTLGNILIGGVIGSALTPCPAHLRSILNPSWSH